MVEFEYNSDDEPFTGKGVVGLTATGKEVLWFKRDNRELAFWTSLTGMHTSILKCVGHCEGPDDGCWQQTVTAYFTQPTFEGTYEQRQAAWVEHYGVEVGTKVRVVRKFKFGEDGFNVSWIGAMNESIGKVVTFERPAESGRGLYFKELGCRYPYFVLEVV